MHERPDRPRVYLVDASVYVFRAWFSWPPEISDSEGHAANAVHGYADFLDSLLRRVEPEYIACAFDGSLGSSFRNEIYPPYKANREPAPEELKRQFAHCRRLTRAMGIAEFGSDRFEADDIIGTLAAMMRAQGHPVTIVTSDKDLTQLLRGEDDEWWDYARNRRLDTDAVCERFGVPPGLIADMLALAGDPVDNIPGVPGIGPKTASALLNRYGCLDGIYHQLAEIPESDLRGARRIHDLLRRHEHDARMALSLTRVHEQAPIDAGPADLAWPGADAELLEAVIEQTGITRRRFSRWLWHRVSGSEVR